MFTSIVNTFLCVLLLLLVENIVFNTRCCRVAGTLIFLNKYFFLFDHIGFILLFIIDWFAYSSGNIVIWSASVNIFTTCTCISSTKEWNYFSIVLIVSIHLILCVIARSDPFVLLYLLYWTKTIKVKNCKGESTVDYPYWRERYTASLIGLSTFLSGVRNHCVIKTLVVFCCSLEFSMGVGVFIIGLSQISSFFSHSYSTSSLVDYQY